MTSWLTFLMASTGVSGLVSPAGAARATNPAKTTVSAVADRIKLVSRIGIARGSVSLGVGILAIFIVTAKLGLARPTQVCDLLQLDMSTLSRNVERMRAHGWLEVVPDEDARTQSFRLTAQGKRLIEKAVPAWEKAQQQASELLGDEGIALLDKAARSCEG